MIHSMTGFGKESNTFQSKTVTVEIRSLNSRQLDLNLKIPTYYKVREMDIRTLISKEIQRGKVEVNITIDSDGEESMASINTGLAKKYYSEIKDLIQDFEYTENIDILRAIITLPEVVRPGKAEMTDDEWVFLEDLLKKAIEKLQNFRASEGAHTEEAIISYCENIKENLKQVDNLKEERAESFKSKLLNGLAELKKDVNFDQNRYEQELIYYLEKLDISEEIVRLGSHTKYFEETVRGELPNGKKLNFISQEMGREINTIGSKANFAPIQKIVVVMKDDLEKIKEQCANIL